MSERLDVLSLKTLAKENMESIQKAEQDRKKSLEKVLNIKKTVIEKHDDDCDTACTSTNQYRSINTVSDFVDITPIPIEPVEIGIIRDTKGILSDKIDKKMEELGVSVIPLTCCGILPQVAELKRHTIFVFNERYAMRSGIRQHVIDEYKERIIDSLKDGVPFVESIIYRINVSGVTYSNIKLTEDEWIYLASLFRNYSFKLLKSHDNLTISVGVM